MRQILLDSISIRTGKWAWRTSLVSAFFIAAAGQPVDPASKPFLRVETGMHTAVIFRIDADREGRYLVTGSNDKTVRVWELSSGRLLRTLRPPIGSGIVGKIYAVALSPDGETVAAGGWTAGQEGSNIYRWRRRDGHMLPPIGGLPNVVNDLAFSPDGSRLAAVFSNGELQVFRASDGTEMARDTSCKKRSLSVAFDRRGRLATSCYDGRVLIYDAGLKKIVEAKAPGGNRPYQVRFSPDGRHLAVGYYDIVRVDVLSGEDLSLIRQPDVNGIQNGNLSIIAWSPDGRFLFAAGRFQRAGTIPIFRWADAGRGARTEWPLAESTIMDLEALHDGRLAFGAAEPTWGVVDGSGSLQPRQRSVTANFRGLLGGFRASEDSASVRLAYRSGGKDAAVFSVARLQFEAEEPPGLLAPRIKHDHLQVKSWKDSYQPKLNGRPLPIETLERSRSLAISSQGDFLVLGTEWYLRCFDRQGEQRWRVDVPSIAWAVNLAAQDQLVLAAFGDGTIRWYRAQDGQELLAFFPHADKRRWVAWTPSGYYAASVQGEDLIGWHVNRGPDQSADFFPASVFRDRYRRPDVVQRILYTRDEDKAVAEADAARGIRTGSIPPLAKTLPPVVTILSPQDGLKFSRDRLTIRVEVRSPSGLPVVRVWPLVDGRSVREAVLEEDTSSTEGIVRTLKVPLPPRDCTVSVLAETAHSTSEPASIKVRRPSQIGARRPNLYILSVGVGSYQNPNYRLKFPAKDAQEFAQAWQSQQGRIYQRVQAKVLTDEKATKGDIQDGLDWLVREAVRREDVAIIFLSGHGLNDPATFLYNFLPYKADLNRRSRTFLPDTDLLNAVKALPGHVYVFLDTCYSGNLLKGVKAPDAVDITKIVDELSSAETGVVVFSASGSRQFSLESDEWKNGVFTRALLDALGGKSGAQGADGVLRISELEKFVYQEVRRRTGEAQSPVVAKPGGVPDLPLAWFDKK